MRVAYFYLMKPEPDRVSVVAPALADCSGLITPTDREPPWALVSGALDDHLDGSAHGDGLRPEARAPTWAGARSRGFGQVSSTSWKDRGPMLEVPHEVDGSRAKASRESGVGAHP